MRRLQDYSREALPDDLLFPELDVRAMVAVDDALVPPGDHGLRVEGVTELDIWRAELVQAELALHSLLVPQAIPTIGCGRRRLGLPIGIALIRLGAPLRRAVLDHRTMSVPPSMVAKSWSKVFGRMAWPAFGGLCPRALRRAEGVSLEAPFVGILGEARGPRARVSLGPAAGGAFARAVAVAMAVAVAPSGHAATGAALAGRRRPGGVQRATCTAWQGRALAAC
mmetsp:Transcript_119720/g.343973  ORF Transcript_119720/g.343973 Transcript_119720/m.343973 type:complete len:224 (+) Transcript_119720:338-1009(+)